MRKAKTGEEESVGKGGTRTEVVQAKAGGILDVRTVFVRMPQWGPPRLTQP